MDKDFMLNYYDKMVRPTWTELMKTPRYQRAACERDKIEREFRRLLDEKLGRKYLELDDALFRVIRKDTSEVPPRYLVFFKAPDAEAFQSAFKEYSASLLNKDKRPSVLARLQELVQAAAELPCKVRHKEQERGL